MARKGIYLRSSSADHVATAKTHLRSGLRRALALESRSLVCRATTTLALVHDLESERGERDEVVNLWRQWQDGDAVRLAAQREEVKRIGHIVRLVGVKAATNWR